MVSATLMVLSPWASAVYRLHRVLDSGRLGRSLTEDSWICRGHFATRMDAFLYHSLQAPAFSGAIILSSHKTQLTMGKGDSWSCDLNTPKYLF